MIGIIPQLIVRLFSYEFVFLRTFLKNHFVKPLKILECKTMLILVEPWWDSFFLSLLHMRKIYHLCIPMLFIKCFVIEIHSVMKGYILMYVLFHVTFCCLWNLLPFRYQFTLLRNMEVFSQIDINYILCSKSAMWSGFFTSSIARVWHDIVCCFTAKSTTFFHRILLLLVNVLCVTCTKWCNYASLSIVLLVFFV